MSNTAFSKTKINIKKSSWIKKSIIGASMLSILAGLGFGVYRAAETDTSPPVRHRKSVVHGHNETSSHLPVFAHKTKSAKPKKSLVQKKSKKHVVSTNKKSGKKSEKKLAASKHKKPSKVASTSKHKKPDLSKLSQKPQKHGKHSKQLAKHKKNKKSSKNLAAK